MGISTIIAIATRRKGNRRRFNRNRKFNTTTSISCIVSADVLLVQKTPRRKIHSRMFQKVNARNVSRKVTPPTVTVSSPEAGGRKLQTGEGRKLLQERKRTGRTTIILFRMGTICKSTTTF